MENQLKIFKFFFKKNFFLIFDIFLYRIYAHKFFENPTKRGVNSTNFQKCPQNEILRFMCFSFSVGFIQQISIRIKRFKILCPQTHTFSKKEIRYRNSEIMKKKFPSKSVSGRNLWVCGYWNLDYVNLIVFFK